MSEFPLVNVDRRALVLMALDANFPVGVVVGYSLARFGEPLAVLLEEPWLLLMSVAFPLFLAITGMYYLRRAWWSPAVLARLFAVSLGVTLLFAAGAAVAGEGADLAGLFPLLAGTMGAETFLARGLVAAKAQREQKVRTAFIVGAGWAGRTVIDIILREPQLRLRIAGFVDDDPLKRSLHYKGVPVVGTGQSLRALVERERADLVIVAISSPQNAELIKGLLQLRMRGVDVVDMPAFVERATGQIPIKHVQDTWFLYSAGFDLLRRPVLQWFKRAVDVAASVAGLVLSLPLMAIVALLIKLDSRGPVFFRQERTGLNEKPFLLIKFRSMRSDAEAATGPVWASVRDYRVTRVGRWLRLTRLDEIPQFLNVLRGDMSFVGPRPERPFFVEKLKREIPYYSLRFAVKPGLSGWAQVQYQYGSSVEDAVEKLKYDLYYIKNMSWWLDIWIALKTLKVVLLARGN